MGDASAEVEGAPAEPAPKRGRGRGRRKAPAVVGPSQRASGGLLSDAEIFAMIERNEGAVDPMFVMILFRAHQALVATNRAQREVIGKLGDEIKGLKTTLRKEAR